MPCPARADNAAQDAGDRFTFRTTDKTIWFDAKDSAAVGPMLPADMQQTAILTVAAIILIRGVPEMALISQLTSVSSANTVMNLGLLNDGFVGQGVSVASADAAIAGSGSNQSVFVAGTVLGLTAVRLGDNPTADANLVLQVAATGQLLTSTPFGAAAILTGTNVDVVNLGLIQSLALNTGGNVFQSNVFNTGRIEGLGNALSVGGVGSLSIENSGTIISGFSAIFCNQSAGVHLDNTGRIIGDVRLGSAEDEVINAGVIRGTLRMGDGDDRVENLGRISGIVNLNEGDDSYDGSQAERTSQVLRVTGGEGNDTFTVGAAREVIEGEGGRNVLFLGRLDQGATVFLDDSGTNAGGSEGDTYFGIRQVIGTRFADRISGVGTAELLDGNRGADVIMGGFGADTLTGGFGADTLTGGRGNDVFLFEGPGLGADRITDFGNAAGNNDTIQILAAAFGGGLAVGALAPSAFRARADNLAQDANDRFIFRTTDTTLWFDANGRAAGGLVLVADLQAGATLTAADILLV